MRTECDFDTDTNLQQKMRLRELSVFQQLSHVSTVRRRLIWFVNETPPRSSTRLVMTAFNQIFSQNVMLIMRSLDGHHKLFHVWIRYRPSLFNNAHNLPWGFFFKKHLKEALYVLIYVPFQILAQLQHLLPLLCFPKVCLVRAHLPHTTLSVCKWS